MKKITFTKKIIFLYISFLFFLIGKVSANDLFISEYVEGSSNNKAIEIYNSTGVAIDLAAADYKIEMYFNGSTTVGLTIPLIGTIVNNGVFVLAHASAVLPINPNQTSNANWFNGDDAIMLKRGTTVLDVIGQIGFDPGTEWGVGLVSTADNTLRRKNNFCLGDTNCFNVFDPSIEWDGFSTNDFSGLGSHNSCSAVSPLKGSVTSLNFSTTVGVPSLVQSYTLQGKSLTADVTVISSDNFEVSINATGQFSNILTIPKADAVIGKLIYVRYIPLVVGSHLGNISHSSDTVSAIVSLQGTNDIINTTIPIYTIQGTGAASAYEGLTVTTEGLVVGDFQEANQLKGFYIQDTIGDANPSSSDGIFIYNATFTVNIGDYVSLTGEVAEFNKLTEIKNVTSLTTILTRKTIPSTAIKLPIFQLEDFEKYEGMLVNFVDTLTVTENYNLGRLGELTLSSQGRIINPTNSIDPNDNPASGNNSNGTSNVAAIIAQQKINLNRSILLDDGSTIQNPPIVPYIDSINKTLRAGTTVSNLVGILDFAFGTYRIQPTITPSFNYALRPTVPAVGSANIKVASFNVLNYFNGDGSGAGFPTERGANTMAEFTRQRTKIIEALKQMNVDVVGLMEMENDGDGANSAIADLVNGLNTALGKVTYNYILDPVAPNGNISTDAIKQAIIYKIATLNPYRASVADTSSAYNVNGYARHPLSQTFTLIENGEKFSIIVNHFKSKSCGNATGVDLDQNDGQACYNDSRKKQAAQLLNFLAQVKTTSADNDVILLGDFNAYEQEDPIDILRAGGLTNLIADNYSFVFNGNAGSLDHALVTPELAARVTGAEKWHVNADEPRIKDYNQEFNPAYVYRADAFRSSDHDPIIVGLNLKPNTLNVHENEKLDNNETAISVYPNPTSNISLVNIKLLNIANENAQIIITDMVGKLLLNQPVLIENNLVTKSIHFPHELIQGIYIINFITSKKVFTERLIIK
ncbi:MAG: ExeM/NucH family extracellular endonuclease [Bacteroidia bacterium]